jgi:hypothetical protein
MNYKSKIILMLLSVLLLISASATAAVKVENQRIEVDLTPARITDSTYLPLERLAERGFFELDKINDNKYYLLTDDAYYSLESGKKLVKSNARNINLKNPPLNINGYFLIPVEFLNGIFKYRISVTEDSTDWRGEETIKYEDLSFRVYLNEDEFRRYEELEISIEIMNTGRDDIELRFNSGQKYNIYIKNRFGRILYSWSEGKMFTQSVQNLEIEGRDSLSFKEEIALSQFREGKYFLEVEIMADNYDFKTVEKEFEIDD